MRQKPKNEKSRYTVDEKKQKTRDEGRELLYTSCGPAAHAFLPLRSIQANTASSGQAGFASHKPLRFQPSGLQTPPVLRRRKVLALPRRKPPSPPPPQKV